METLTLPDQPAVENRLRETAARGALPHALIFSGPGDRLAAAQFAAAAFECTAQGRRPCGVCEACRKVLAGIHPDVTVVHDPEHKIMSVDLVRSVRSDAYIIPNEGARKVYLFDDCGQLDDRCQDILLKVVEEGPPYAAFLFCAENSAGILPTLRSRCVELKLRPRESQGTDTDERAAELCRLVARRQMPGLVRFLTGLETGKIKREELGALLEEAREVFAAAALSLYGQPCPPQRRELAAQVTENLTKAQIMRTIELFQSYRRECDWNVGTGHVLGALAEELEGIL